MSEIERTVEMPHAEGLEPLPESILYEVGYDGKFRIYWGNHYLSPQSAPFKLIQTAYTHSNRQIHTAQKTTFFSFCGHGIIFISHLDQETRTKQPVNSPEKTTPPKPPATPHAPPDKTKKN